MKNEFKESRESFLNIQKNINQIRERIEQRKKQIERLEKKRDRLWDNSFWGDYLIPPIMKLVKNKYPDITWDDDRLVPMGLCSRISLFGKIKDKTIILCFTPSNLSEGIIAYDTEERKGDYPKNSIGSWNQMDKVSEDITDIEQIYTHIEKQLNKTE